MEIGIIADDLTGAADAAAFFAGRGYRASVGLKRRHPDEPFPSADGDALAYDTATRELAADQAAAIKETLRQAARRLAEWKPRMVFKKIDSTLRGHLRLELEAVRQEFPNRLAIVCPAFPSQGRTVQAGILHIDNRPWTATEFAPKHLSNSSTVCGAFGMEGEGGAKTVAASNIRQGADVLEAQWQEYATQGAHTLFCDAENDHDLNILAQIILRQPHAYLPVGSAGLARAIGAVMPARPLENPVFSLTFNPFPTGRILVIVGSLHTASRRQEAFLSARIQASPVVVGHSVEAKAELEQAAANVYHRYANGQRVVVLTTPNTPDRNNRQGYADTVGSVALRVCRRQSQADQPLNALVICGGNTALELCHALHGTGLRIQGELQPGIPFSHLIAGQERTRNLHFDGLPLVTKAGGFGDEATLARCVGLL